MKMGLEVWGDYACFRAGDVSRAVSYDVMTPSQPRDIRSYFVDAAIMARSQIEVLNPIRWISVRRNEVDRIEGGPTHAQLEGKNSDPMGLYIEDCRQQRAGLFLRDVRYRIHAWFEFIPPEKRADNRPCSDEMWADAQEREAASRADEKEAKYAAMFERRATKGQCFQRPYLGCREFACDFRLVNGEDDKPVAIDKTDQLGWMLYDMDYADPANPKPFFFRAKLELGVVNADRRNMGVEVRDDTPAL